MTAAHSGSHRRVNAMYILLQICFWGMMAAFSGYQAAIVQGRGFSSGQAGLFLSLGFLAGMVAQPVLGRWADRHPEVPLKRIFGGCMLLALAIHGVFFFTRPGLAGTAVIFLALGALETNAYPLIDAMAMQFLNAGLDVKYSLGRGLGAFSYAGVSVLVGWQARRFGVESALVAHAALVVCILLSVAFFPVYAAPPAEEGAPPKTTHSFWYILKHNPPFTLMLLSGFFGMAAALTTANFLVNVVTDRGGDSGDLGVALFLMAASELPGALLFHKLRRRCGTAGVLLFSSVFVMLRPLVFLLGRSLTALLLLQPIQMLGYGLFTPANVYYANENVPPEDRVQGQSLKMVATNGLGGMAGSLLAGTILDWGGADAMLLFCTLCGAAGVVMAVLSLHMTKKHAKCRDFS